MITEPAASAPAAASAAAEVVPVKSLERPPHAYNEASLISRLFFLWPWPLLKLGLERPLTDADLAEVSEEDSSRYNLEFWQSLWDPATASTTRGGGGRSHLSWPMFREFVRSTWYVQPLYLAGMTAKVVQAICLGKLINSFSSGTRSNTSYFWAMGIVICAGVTLLEHHNVFLFLWHKGMQFRVACVAAIYRKSLRLSSTHPQTLASSGRIMNLASNDVERLIYVSLFIYNLFWAPVQAIGILFVGIYLMGPAFCAGIALLALVFVPLQFYLSRQFAYYRSSVAALTDQRVAFVSQAVRGARVMKMSGYEYKFLDRIREWRQQEVQQLISAIRLKAANETVFYVTNVVVSLVVFLAHVYSGGVLKVGEVFTVFTLVNVMQLELVKHCSMAVMATSECYVSIGRIQQFLEFPEIPHRQAWPSTSSECTSVNVSSLDSRPAISMNNVCCRWDYVQEVALRHQSVEKNNNNNNNSNPDGVEISKASGPLALDCVTVDFYPGTLTAVIGPVGSGKSALLLALVQELAVVTGSVERRYQSMAYASQDPWIMDGTIQENILMGLQWDSDWYGTVVEACSLGLDFHQLRDGDQTVVGDRGVQLSGGQRARVGLARALYKNADVLIADDPLSAVDARVGRHLFQEAILNLSVRKGKCVVLATHQHQYITETRCLLIFGGRIKCTGSYSECLEASEGKLAGHDADTSTDNLLLEQQPADITASTKVEGKGPDGGANEGEAAGNWGKKKTGHEKELNEKNRQGVVTTETYVNYVKAFGGLWIGFCLLVLYACTQGAVLATIAFMSQWARRPAQLQKNTDIITTVVAMSALVILLAAVRAFLSLELTITASQRLHDRMAQSVLRAKIEFFDTNPLGRILNRFSADVGVADDQLPQALYDVLVIGFVVVGALVTSVITLPYTLVIIPFLVWYFARVRHIFVSSTRELKRLEGLARSPIFAMLSEALGGIATIRGNDYIPYFMKKFHEVHDSHTRAFDAFIGASRWVGFRMDSIVFLFLTIVSFLAVAVQNAGFFNVDPSILGLSISMLIYLAGIFQWCIRQSAEVVNHMVSVERVIEFGKLEPEAELHQAIDDKLMVTNWPQSGEIKYEQVSVRYRSTLPLALRKISFCIPAGSRVGVVGRTGSGKSTVVQSLFRLLEAEEGQILIDGEDISKLGLHTLRTKISAIPQVPTLFSGCSVRENLDLFHLNSDERINEVLKSCHLSEVIAELPNGWNSVVLEGGANFSVGQRQLLCLARAILSKNKILILDEATASVDRRTDQLLQQALYECYQDGTILAVAHRLDTVIDYDFILVLGQGEVIEFGSPSDLLSKEDGMFARMVNDTGDAMSKLLRERARQRTLDRSNASQETVINDVAR